MKGHAWQRLAMACGRSAWPAMRRLRGMVAWIARTAPELRVEHRLGRMYGRHALIGAVRRELRPLDLIVERGPIKVSDAFIPGHFKHVAIYVGPRLSGQIQRLAIGRSRGRRRIRTNLVILEATRKGVRLASLDTFFRTVDTFVVLRGRTRGAAARRRLAERAAGELGKAYDFNFDLADHRRQFCCKLVADLLPEMPFEDLLNTGAPVIADEFVLPTVRRRRGAPKAVLLVEDARQCRPEARNQRLEELLEAETAESPATASARCSGTRPSRGRTVRPGARSRPSP